MDSILQFEAVDTPEALLEIVNLRLPRSTHIFNMIKLHPTFPTEMSFYQLKTSEKPESTWILAKYLREDTGQQLAMSTPNDTDKLEAPIEKAFEAIDPNILNWNQQFEFIGLDLVVTELVIKISMKNGNCTEVLPCQFFHFPRNKPVITKPSPVLEKFELKSLKSEPGIKFLVSVSSQFNSLNENSKAFRIKLAERCPTIGAYAKDTEEVVSGALLNPSGHVGIVTNEPFQRQGLGHACFQKLVQYLIAETSLIPCSMVYLKNHNSLKLHYKGEHEATHTCYFVFYKAKEP